MPTRQKTALISVYNKEGIADFAKELVSLGWKIISSGGTAKHLSDAGIPVTDVAEITGFPAILGHRVVTLHPKIHGGLLALDTPEHNAELEKYGIPRINMVCCDLYPLEEEILKHTGDIGCPLGHPMSKCRESVIEKTDIGGPTMLRSGAKGGRIVICDLDDRGKVLEWLKNGEPDKEEFLNKLRAKAEALISRYTGFSAMYHSAGIYKSVFGKRKLECAYGENAYQKPASLYRSHGGDKDSLAIINWQLLEGSPLSYNNICDLDRMLQTMTHIGAGFEKNFPPKADQPRAGSIPFIAIGAKHGNACGAGLCLAEAGSGLAKAGVDPRIEAIDKMLMGDLRAIFGGSVMVNFSVDEKIAEELINKFSPAGVRRLLDIVAAPSFSPEAVEILSRKKGKCRLLVNKNIEKAGLASLDSADRFRYVRGGFMQQPNYTFLPAIASATAGVPESVLKDVILAWAVGCTSNSNTITIVKEGRLYGNGVGQQDRVGAAKLAIFRADDAAEFASDQQENSLRFTRQNPTGSDATQNFPADLQNAVAYSDSFFPFPDAPEVLINRGIKTIFATSGSVNDEKIIELCRQKGVNLIMLPDAEARGFYQH